MDGNVWLQRSEDGDSTEQGDVVLIPSGSVVRVGEVLADGELAVRAEVAPELLPGLPDVSDEPRQIDDEDLLRAVRGVVAAERERGG